MSRASHPERETEEDDDEDDRHRDVEDLELGAVLHLLGDVGRPRSPPLPSTRPRRHRAAGGIVGPVGSCWRRRRTEATIVKITRTQISAATMMARVRKICQSEMTSSPWVVAESGRPMFEPQAVSVAATTADERGR